MSRSEIAGLLEMIRDAPRADTIAELRANMLAFVPFLAADAPAMARVDEGVTVGPQVLADVLVPPGTPPFPVLVYLHGGGWSIGSPASHGKLARQLAVGAGVVVVNVDYRLAPEHPFPVPLDDCVTAARWTRANIARWGGDPQRIAIGGDSAGGNLSAAVINDLQGEIAFRGALLLYGAFDVAGAFRDYDRWAPAEDPLLPKATMKLMIDAYFSGGASNDDPRMSPLRADLTAFPPACLVCGTWDPLLGESIAFHERLQKSGRRSVLHRYAEMPHGFLHFPASEATAALEQANAFLRAVLAPA
jgi:acetyl esterase